MSYGTVIVSTVWGITILLTAFYFWLKWRTDELLEEPMVGEEK